jgi:hypothetical protein
MARRLCRVILLNGQERKLKTVATFAAGQLPPEATIDVNGVWRWRICGCSARVKKWCSNGPTKWAGG